MGVMDDDIVLELLIKRIAELILEFLDRRRTVETGGDQQLDLNVGAAFAQLTDHIGENILAGDRSCMITDDDNTVIFSFCEFAQTRTVNGILHRLAHNIESCPVAGKLTYFAGQDWCIVRNLQILCCVCVRKFDCFHKSACSPFCKRGIVICSALW